MLPWPLSLLLSPGVRKRLTKNNFDTLVKVFRLINIVVKIRNVHPLHPWFARYVNHASNVAAEQLRN